MANDLLALAILLANIWAALSGLAASRAWWPRHDLSCEPRSTRVFYAALIGLMLAFTGNASVRAVAIIAGWPLDLGLSSYDDLLWRSVGAIACLGLVASKFLALPAHERADWNMVTIIFHPDADQFLVRFWNAAMRRMRRRRET